RPELGKGELRGRGHSYEVLRIPTLHAMVLRRDGRGSRRGSHLQHPGRRDDGTEDQECVLSRSKSKNPNTPQAPTSPSIGWSRKPGTPPAMPGTIWRS